MTSKLHFVITPNLQIIDGFLTGGNAADIGVADALTALMYLVATL